MILVNVWITLPDGQRVRVGDLLAEDPDVQGAYRSEFEYSRAWQEHPRGFALVTGSTALQSLPLDKPRHPSRGFDPPLAIFDDALPDSWGRTLLIERLLRKDPRLPNARRSAPYLLIEMGAEGLGALSFGADDEESKSHASVSAQHLSSLMQAAEAFEAGKEVEDEALRRLLMAGSTVGGARPKALVQDEAGHWIAKFMSGKDGMIDVVGLESAGMAAAKDAGLSPAETKLVRLGKRKALLVKRFDLSPKGRRHMASLRTLLGERMGSVSRFYKDLADAVRYVSAAPAQDVRALYRQMVFNAALGNTDDHTKNFWMMRDEDGWRLTPAFDLVPNYQRQSEHQLAFEYQRYCPNGRTLGDIAQAWMVEGHDAIIREVVEGARTFAAHAAKADVPKGQIKQFSEDVERRCLRILEDPVAPKPPFSGAARRNGGP